MRFKSVHYLIFLLIFAQWGTYLFFNSSRETDVRSAWFEVELETVREVAHGLKIFIGNVHRATWEQDSLGMDEEIADSFIQPMRLLNSGRGWLFRGAKLVYSAGPYLGENHIGEDIRQICYEPVRRGGAGIDALSEGVVHGTSGALQLDWDGDTSLHAAWASFELGGESWVVGLFVPEDEIFAFSGLPGRMRREGYSNMAITALLLLVMYILAHQQRRSEQRSEELEAIVARRTREVTGANTDLSRELAARKQAEASLVESQEMYRALVENSPDIVMRFDRAGRHLFVNRAVKSITGMEPEDCIGKTHRELGFPEDLCDYLEERIEKVFSTGRPLSEMVAYRTPAGIMYFDWSMTPESVSDGQVVTVLNSARDVTPRKQAEEGLRQSEAKYRLLVENQSDVVIKLDESGRFLFASPSFFEMFELEEGAVLGKRFLPVIHRDDWRKALQAWKDMLSPPHTFRVQMRTGSGGRGWSWVAWAGKGIFDDQGKLREVVSIGRDITERKLAAEHIEESLAEKEVMLQEIHHRVKNNLQVICSLLDLAERRISSDEDREVFRDIHSKIQGMSLIHSQLYQSERFDSVDIGSYAQLMYNHLVHMFGVTGVKTELSLEKVLIPLSKAIPFGLVLNEIVSNAFKHALRDGIGTLSLSVSRQGEGPVILRIADDGPGMEVQIAGNGRGSMGLKLVENIVRFQLGGTLSITPARGGKDRPGTEFTVVFDPMGEDVKS